MKFPLTLKGKINFEIQGITSFYGMHEISRLESLGLI